MEAAASWARAWASVKPSKLPVAPPPPDEPPLKLLIANCSQTSAGMIPTQLAAVEAVRAPVPDQVSSLHLATITTKIIKTKTNTAAITAIIAKIVPQTGAVAAAAPAPA